MSIVDIHKMLPIILRYTKDEFLWEDLIATFSNENGFQMIPDPNSNPIMYYIKWDVVYGDGWSPVITNDQYTNGFNCPFDISEKWLYEYQGHW